MRSKLTGLNGVGTWPDLHYSITARRGDMGTIRRPGHVVHLPDVTAIGVEQASGADIPHLYPAIGSGKSKMCTIWRPRKGHDQGMV